MKRPTTRRTSKSRGEVEGYRSGLEEKVAAQLEAEGVPVRYEAHTLKYVKPEKEHRYTPDFVLPNGIVIETKGRFVTADRQKHLHIKRCHPHLDIRFVFSNPNQRIGKKSQTTYAMWCQKNGFLFSARLVTREWIKEPPVPSRIRAANQALGWTP